MLPLPVGALNTWEDPVRSTSCSTATVCSFSLHAGEPGFLMQLPLDFGPPAFVATCSGFKVDAQGQFVDICPYVFVQVDPCAPPPTRPTTLQSVICVVCSEVATPLICPNKSLWLSNGLSVWTCFEVCCGGPKIDNRHNFNHKFKGRPHVALPGFIYLRTSRQEHLLFHMPEESGHHPALIWPKDRPLGRSCVSAAGSRFAAWTGGECHGIRRKNAHGIHVEGVF